MKFGIKKGVAIVLTLMVGMMATTASHRDANHRSPFAVAMFKDTSWTKSKAAAWFNSRAWLNGSKLKPHSSIDQLRFAREYASNKTRWDKGFAYLKSVDLKTIKAGHYQIEGEDVYANVTEAPSKPYENTQYEVHQNYSDIHLMITGKEKIGVTSFAGATVKTPYDPVKDIGFWNKADDKIYTAEPGTFFIFFPGSPHRPTIKVEGQDVVKKIVIKIKSAGK